MGYTIRLVDKSVSPEETCILPFTHRCEGDANIRVGGSNECYISSLTYNYTRNDKVKRILATPSASGFAILDGMTGAESRDYLRRLLDELDRNDDWDLVAYVLPSEAIDKNCAFLQQHIDETADSIIANYPSFAQNHSKNWIERNLEFIRNGGTYSEKDVVKPGERWLYKSNELLGYWAWCDKNVWVVVKRLVDWAEYFPNAVWEVS